MKGLIATDCVGQLDWELRQEMVVDEFGHLRKEPSLAITVKLGDEVNIKAPRNAT